MRRQLATWIARIRMPLLWGSFLLLILSVIGVLAAPYWLVLGLLVLAMAFYFKVGTVREPTVHLSMPVDGRWRAINSPADRVPSHRLHAYGQTYAIDLIRATPERDDVTIGWWPLTQPPEEFAAFGEPVRSPTDGTVVRTYERARDHRSRSSWPALVYLLAAEAFAREITGPKRILGNHVIIQQRDGACVALAHLRRGSLRVTVGDHVRVGEVIAECGNSGNTSEPHLHVQAMDRPDVVFAAGLPAVFDDYEVGGHRQRGVPGHDEPFVVHRPMRPEAAIRSR